MRKSEDTAICADVQANLRFVLRTRLIRFLSMDTAVQPISTGKKGLKLYANRKDSGFDDSTASTTVKTLKSP